MTDFNPGMLPPQPTSPLSDEDRAKAEAILAAGGNTQGKLMFLHWLGSSLKAGLEQKGFTVKADTRTTGFTLTVDLPIVPERNDVRVPPPGDGHRT